MLQQAIDFLAKGKHAEAKEILTHLLKVDQNNAQYWVWLSAAMDTPKERLYCLQTAYKIDPSNHAAKRGLVMMGALPPDANIQTFPMNHPRPWVDKVKISNEADKPTGIRRFTSNPIFRVAAIVIVGVLLLGGVIAGFAINASMQPEWTPLPAYTLGPTATMIPNKTAAAVPTGSLLALLDATYTPTAIYAATPHADLAGDSYRGAMRAYQKQQWDMVALMMQQVATAQPGAADPLYFVAESYRLSNRFEEALQWYQNALDVNPSFAPIYLGRARTNIALHPKPTARQINDIKNDLEKAVQLDPNFAEAHLERGMFLMKRGDNVGAETSLLSAAQINPDSPIIQVELARVELELGNNEAALDAAIKANQLDITMLDGYLVLGMAYRANGEMDKAVEVLEKFSKYDSNNSEVYWVLGSAYYGKGRYEDAITAFNRALQIDKTSSEAYFWRGETYMALKEYDKAVDDYRKSFQYNENSFKAGLAISKALILTGDGNNAYAQILKIEGLVQTDQEKALLLYYRAKSLGMITNQPNTAAAALKDWQALLALPADVMTPEMRAEAEAAVNQALVTATPNPKSLTPTVTPTPGPTRQPTATIQPTQTRFPTATP